MKPRRLPKPNVVPMPIKVRRDAIQWAKEHSSPSLPKQKELRLPGGLEKALDLLRKRIVIADKRQRDALDEQVKGCHILARYLKDNPTSQQTSFGGEWTKFYLRTKKNPSAALKFVCTRAYADNKKGSYYYRATKKMFESGVKFEDISGFVTAAGGYDALVKQNARPRPPKDTEPASACNDKEEVGRTENEPIGSHGEAQKEPRTNHQTVRSKKSAAQKSDEQITLRAVLGPEGSSFERLPDGCRAHIDVEILGFDGNEWSVRIIAAASIVP